MDELNIIKSVVLGDRHEYYEDTKEQAKLGYEVTTGEGQESYIIRLKQEWSESKLSDRHKKEKVHAKKLYNSATAAAYHKLAGYFERVYRVDKAANKLTLEGKDEKTIKFKDELENFGGSNIIDYLETNYLYLNGADPNSWLLLDTKIIEGKERINPVIIPAKDALNYQNELGDLKYLAVQSVFKTKSKDLKEYLFYFKQSKHRVIEDSESLTNEDKEGAELLMINESKYYIWSENNPLDMVCAIRWGYMFNYETQGKTYGFFWQAAKNLMKDLMDRKFQLDMSYMLHTFLQKVQYGDKCTYHDQTRECNGGIMSGTDETCPSCKGSGLKVHKDASDLIVIAFPEEGEAKAKIPPKDIAAYITLPFDIVKEQREQVEKLPIKMAEAVLGVDLDKTSTGINTATEITSRDDLAADKLASFADGLTHLHSFVVQCMAKILQIPKETYSFSLSYPNEFNLESLAKLLQDLKSAKDANASYSVIKAIEDKIASKQNKGNRSVLDFQQALNKFKPFKQLTKEQIDIKLSDLPETNKYRVIFEYFDLIGQTIQEDYPDFAERSNQAKKVIFDKVLQVYIDEVRAEIEANRDLFREEIETINNEDEL